jgi:hypothetical protein
VRKTTRKLFACALALQLAVLALPATASEHGREKGTVEAEVTVVEEPEACLLVSVERLDFGLLDFGDVETSQNYTVSSCSRVDQDFWVSGTDATSEGATWELAWLPDKDKYRLQACTPPTCPNVTTVPMLAFANVEKEESRETRHFLWMPEKGSQGAGQTFQFAINWTAVLSD